MSYTKEVFEIYVLFCEYIFEVMNLCNNSYFSCIIFITRHLRKSFDCEKDNVFC